MKKKLSLFHLEKLFLIVILFLAAYLRFYNLNWDQGHMFHPDERNLAAAVSRVEFPQKLNPEFFAYNGLTIYLMDIVSQIIFKITQNNAWLIEWGNLNLIGRSLSALFSVLTVFLVYKLSKKIFPAFALIASTITALTVGFIQYAHYGVTESELIFLLLLIVCFSLDLSKKPSFLKVLLLSFLAGVSLATKTTAAYFLMIPNLSLLLFSFKKKKAKTLFYLPLFTSISLIFAIALSPCSLINFDKFKESMSYEHGVVSGKNIVPYNMQFTGTKPYLYQLQSMTWQLSFPLVFLGLIGGVLWTINALRKKSDSLPFIIFSWSYFGYVGFWHAKFIRYNLLFLPFLIFGFIYLIKVLKKRLKYSTFIIVFFVLISQFVWCLTYLNIFTKQQTRITASNWIYQHIPAGSSILSEHWDDRLPVPLTEYAQNYSAVELKLYDSDNQQKIENLSSQLASGDYLVISSRRLSGSIPKNPDRYPYTSNYHHLLFAEKLGYQQVANFSSYPQLFGFELNDDSAEETFQVYDHPVVFIFQNKLKLDQQSLEKILLQN